MRSRQRERETGLEPATNSLEGCDSSQLSYSRILKIKVSKNIFNYVRFGIQERRLSCGRRGIRTPKGVSQRIYSPPRLSNSGVRPELQTSHKYICIWNKMQIKKGGGFVSIRWINGIYNRLNKFYEEWRYWRIESFTKLNYYQGNKNIKDIFDRKRRGV